LTSSHLVEWDWSGCDIENETAPNLGLLSIHERVQQELLKGTCPIIIYDHGKGEIADFVTIEESGEDTVFNLYHCKGSGGAAAGARIDDVYEVAGQAHKSVVWATFARLYNQLRARRTRRRFVRGDEQGLAEILEKAKSRRKVFRIAVVQPGISKAQITMAMSECLGATNSHLVGSGIKELEVIVSA
jgi:hypothetical protein